MRPLFFSLLLVASGLHAAPADEWWAPTVLSVRMSMIPRRDITTVTMTVAQNRDQRIETSNLSDAKKPSSVLMLVSGNYMVAAPEVALTPGREIDAIDSPVLIAGLAMKLLERGAPGGPGSVDKTKDVNVEEAREPLDLSTQSTNGQYPAPWSLTGTLTRESPSKISFVLSFRFAGETQSLALSGSWTKSSPSMFPDKTSIAGWRVFHLGPVTSSANGRSRLDYGATEIAGGFRTLGALRAYAKQQGDQ